MSAELRKKVFGAGLKYDKIRISRLAEKAAIHIIRRKIMQYRDFGKTGIKVSALGFGA
uniref:hypothetical protein n=1 Tax=Clostridium sp. NkU-1 TaxID=1095009 RepID=UPI000AAFCB36